MDKFRGSLLAGAVGDALGGAIEFEHIDAIRARFGPSGLTDFAPAYGKVGAITDDTQMTLFTLEGLVTARKHGTDPLWDVRAAYGRWLHTQGGPPVKAEGWLLEPKLECDSSAAFGMRPKRRISSAASTVISASCSAVGS